MNLIKNWKKYVSENCHIRTTTKTAHNTKYSYVYKDESEKDMKQMIPTDSVKVKDTLRFDAQASLFFDSRTGRYTGTMRAFRPVRFNPILIRF